MQWFESRKIGRRKIPTSMSALFTMLFLLTIFLGFISLFVPLIVQEAKTISNISTDRLKESWAEPIADLEDWADRNGFIPEGEDKSEFVEKEISSFLEFVSVSDLVYMLLAQIGNILVLIFSVSFITFFLLRDRSMMYRWIYAITPDKYDNRVGDVIRNARKTLRRYFIGILIQIGLMSTIIGVGLTLLDVKSAILIGFLAGIINIIPYLGPLIAGFIGIVVGVSSHLELDFYTEVMPLALKIVIVFSTAQVLDNLLFQPIIFSNSIKAHPLEIFLVILVAGTLGGITGMVLAIPAYSLFRIIGAEFFSQFKIVQTFTRSMKE
jgi:predicted PurR-regulated permease PerM